MIYVLDLGLCFSSILVMASLLLLLFCGNEGRSSSSFSSSSLCEYTDGSNWCVSQNKDLTAAWEEVLIAVGRAGHSDLSQTYVFAVRR